MSGLMVENHVSSKTVFGNNAIRRTAYQPWSRVYRRLLPRQTRRVQHLQHHYRRKVQAQHLFQHQLNVRVQMSKHGAARLFCLEVVRSCRPTPTGSARQYASSIPGELSPETLSTRSGVGSPTFAWANLPLAVASMVPDPLSPSPASRSVESSCCNSCRSFAGTPDRPHGDAPVSLCFPQFSLPYCPVASGRVGQWKLRPLDMSTTGNGPIGKSPALGGTVWVVLLAPSSRGEQCRPQMIPNLSLHMPQFALCVTVITKKRTVGKFNDSVSRSECCDNVWSSTGLHSDRVHRSNLTIPSAAASLARLMRCLSPCHSATCFSSTTSFGGEFTEVVTIVVRRWSFCTGKGSVQHTDEQLVIFSIY